MSRKTWLAALTLLVLTSCGKEGDGKPGGGRGGNAEPSRGSDCLRSQASLQAKNFSSVQAAAVAFAIATRACSATLSEVQAVAMEMQKNGNQIKGEKP